MFCVWLYAHAVLVNLVVKEAPGLPTCSSNPNFLSGNPGYVFD